MPLQTLSGNLAAAVGANGLLALVAGSQLSATSLNALLSDIQTEAAQALLAGVLAGGVCMAAALVITIPVGTLWFAKQVWACVTTPVTVNVADASTTYLWGCSDGQIRQTAAIGTLPATFDATSCCLLCKVVSAAGVATVDNTVQQKGRSISGRVVTDGPLKLDYAGNVIDTSAAALRIPGVTADPTVPSVGVFVWFRTDTLQLCVSNSGVIKRSAAFT